MYFLGIDVGTGGSRALVIDESGAIISSAAEEHRPFASPQIGWAEQDPTDWWRASGVAVRNTLQQRGIRGEQIACVGFSGQMHGAVLLDEYGQVVRPALIWCDVRTEKQAQELTYQIGAERLRQLTCNPALPNFTLTKYLWVRENEPQNWSRVRSVMLPKDYVRFRLTGERATDLVDASGTLLLDVAHRRGPRKSWTLFRWIVLFCLPCMSRLRFADEFQKLARLQPVCSQELPSSPVREIRLPAQSVWEWFRRER